MLLVRGTWILRKTTILLLCSTVVLVPMKTNLPYRCGLDANVTALPDSNVTALPDSKRKISSPHQSNSTKTLMNWTEYFEILSAAEKIHEENEVVSVQFLNEGYINMTKSWICNVRQLKTSFLQKVLFITTDQASYRALSSFGPDLHIVPVPSYSVNSARQMSYGQLVYYRYMLFRTGAVLSMLENGLTVWITESDAVWFKDPTEEFVNTTGDAVVMSDNGVKGEIPQGGLLFLRPSPPTISIWRTVYKALREILDEFRDVEGTEDIRDGGSEQIIFGEVVKNVSNFTMDWVDTAKFAPGKWYSSLDFRKKCPEPWVILNNWIEGNANKEARAKQWKHWFLNEKGTECLVVE